MDGEVSGTVAGRYITHMDFDKRITFSKQPFCMDGEVLGFRDHID
jgi:hypothetical protein